MTNDELLELEKFVNLSDEELLKLNKIFNNIKKQNMNKIYKSFLVLNHYNGGETGIRTQERVAPLPVFKTGAFNRSAISP